MRRALIFILALAVAAPLWAAETASKDLPPNAQTAPAALEKSPRHGEWVQVPVAGGTPVHTWVVYPESATKAPVVIVIHEIFGLTDWVRAVADKLAAEGFIAIAPDLLSGKGPDGGGTDSLKGHQAAVKLVSALDAHEVIARLNAVRDYGLGLPAAAAHSASIGFCWGGKTSFAWAAAQPGLDAAVVYYGTPPADLTGIKAAVLGLYGGADERVTATVQKTGEEMKKLGKSYESHVFDGAGHGFLRQQEARKENMKATSASWPMAVAFLRDHTR